MAISILTIILLWVKEYLAYPFLDLNQNGILIKGNIL
jgi:hypothetical protein